jgi:hypothetical protein
MFFGLTSAVNATTSHVFPISGEVVNVIFFLPVASSSSCQSC